VRVGLVADDTIFTAAVVSAIAAGFSSGGSQLSPANRRSARLHESQFPLGSLHIVIGTGHFAPLIAAPLSRPNPRYSSWQIG